MKKSFVMSIISIAVLGIGLSGCVPAPEPGFGDLMGYVYISDGEQLQTSSTEQPPENYRPLVDAEVRLSRAGHASRSTTTNSQGFFELQDLASGVWTIHVKSDELLDDYTQSVRIYRNMVNILDRGDSVRTGRGYALIIGIDEYEHMADVPFEEAVQVDNAMLVESVFARQLADHSMAISTRELYNEEATHDAIFDSINDVMTKANPDDYFVIYFSGYYGGGFTDADYLIPYDGKDFGNFDNAITDGMLRDWLGYTEDEYRGTHVTVILDLPESSSFIDGFETYKGDFDSSALKDHPRTTVITSGDGPLELHPTENATLFTYYLHRGLEGPWYDADLDDTGTVTSQNLYQYLQDRLSDRGAGMPEMYQFEDTSIIRYR